MSVDDIEASVKGTGRKSDDAYVLDRVEDAQGGQPSATGEPIQDEVWGTLDEGSVKYRNLGWLFASALLTKIQLGLGVLALPAVLDKLGMVPGAILIAVVAGLTSWSGMIFADFKTRYPRVYTLADVGDVMWGPVGREILGGIYWTKLVFITGSNIVAISTAFNAITIHGTCTVVFALVGAVMTFSVAQFQTLQKISWLSGFGVACLMISIITLTVCVGIQERPAAAPPTGPWSPNVNLVGHANFINACNSLATIIISYSGTSSFLNVFSEMRDPRHYRRSVMLCQCTVATIYIIIACTVYHFVGRYIASPALGSAGPLLKRILYGIALPGLLAGAVINAHLPAKYMFVRILRGTVHLTKNTPKHRIVWYGSVLLACVIAFIVSEAVPFFGDLISLVGALLATPISLIVPSYMWWWMSQTGEARPRGSRYWLQFVITFTMFIFAVFVFVCGTYSSVVSINNTIKAGKTSKPFGCADNSGSVRR